MKLHFDLKFLSRQETKAPTMKFAVLALAFGLAAFTPPTSGWTAEVLHSRIKGLVAFAFFCTTENCIDTNVIVEAIDGIERDAPGKPGARLEVNVIIERFDFCQDILLFSAEGSETSSASEFQVDKKLESGKVIKTVEVLDEVSGNSFVVSVDLTWTATSRPEVSRSRFYSRTPGRVSHGQNKGTFRDGIATGIVLLGGTNVIQNATDSFADLESISDGFIDVIKF